MLEIIEMQMKSYIDRLEKIKVDLNWRKQKINSLIAENDITILDLLDYYSIGEILDEIGKQACIDHFDIVEYKDEETACNY